MNRLASGEQVLNPFNHHRLSIANNVTNFTNSSPYASWIRPTTRSVLKHHHHQQQQQQQQPHNSFPLDSSSSIRNIVMPHHQNLHHHSGHHHQSSAAGSASSSLASSSSSSSLASNNNNKPVKMKRTRQRVDAGEPRNSYASIANFSSRGGYHGYNNHKYGSNSNNSGNHHHHHQQHHHHNQRMSNEASSAASNGNNLHANRLAGNSGSNNHNLNYHSMSDVAAMSQHHHQMSDMATSHHHHPSYNSGVCGNSNARKSVLRDSSSFYPGHRSSCATTDAIMEHQATLFQQLCQQSPMAAFMSANHHTPTPQTPMTTAAPGSNKSPPFPSSINTKFAGGQQHPSTTSSTTMMAAADQFNTTGTGYNQAAAFLTQLQSSMNPNNDNNMAMAANFLNNLQANEIAAAAAMANSSLFNANNVAAAAAFDAQLLRDILESGAAAAAAAAAAAVSTANNNITTNSLVAMQSNVESKDKTQLASSNEQSLHSSKHSYPLSTTNDASELNKSSRNGSVSTGNKHRFSVDDLDGCARNLLFDYIADPNINSINLMEQSCLGTSSTPSSTTIHDEHAINNDPTAAAAAGGGSEEKNRQRTDDDDQLAKQVDHQSHEANDYAVVYDDDPVKQAESSHTENNNDPKMIRATSLAESSGIDDNNNDDDDDDDDDDCRSEVVVTPTTADDDIERDGNLVKEERRITRGRPPLHSLHSNAVVTLSQQQTRSNQCTTTTVNNNSSLGSTSSSSTSSSSSSPSAEETISLDRFSSLSANRKQQQRDSNCDQDVVNDDYIENIQNNSIDRSNENLCSNMLLETVPNTNTTVTSINNRLRSQPMMKSDIDDDDDVETANGGHHPGGDDSNNKATTVTQSSMTTTNGPSAGIIINGCKKRKLYQPQQSSKMLNTSNGSIDTEDDMEDDDVGDGDVLDDDDDDDDDGDGDGDDDEEANSNKRRRRSLIGVEDITAGGATEAELDDEGYDESGIHQEQQHQQSLRQRPRSIEQQQKSSESNVNINNKELDLSSNNNININNNHNNNESQAVTGMTTTGRTLNNMNMENAQNSSSSASSKRARISDYERDLSKFQQQLFQKYTALQLYQQQQQSKANQSTNGRSSSTPSYNNNNPQRSSPVTNVMMMNTMMSMNNNNDNNNHSDCDMMQMFAAAAAADSFGGHISPSSSSHGQQQQQQLSTVSEKFCKIYDMDLFVETVTSQVIQSMTRIVANSIRSQLEAQQQQTQQQNHQRSSLKDQNHTTVPKLGATTDLLAQMLDAKYSRQIKMATSPNNNGHHKNGRDTAGSPFVMAAAASSLETSPINKPSSFVYPPNAGGYYGKQASGVYGRDTPVMMVNMNGVRDTTPASSASNVYGGRVVDTTAAVSPVMAAEQTEAISLVVGPAKKRRNKVTDSRLPVRTPTRITRNVNDDHIRETSSVSPPILTNYPAAAATANSLPVSLASLQHASEFFDPTTAAATINTSAKTFPFAEQAAAARLAGTLFNVDDVDQLKNSLTASTNGSSMNGAATGTDAVANAVAAAATAHHLRMFVASRASPDSMSGGYAGAVLSSYGRGSGTGSENGGDGSETNDTQSIYDPSMPMTSTLSPMHLRKAKLMFFYVRYPSSSILKMFFPDIKFNKNNTAQLVKWFSNFREFYYIQMEKYARQALSEGIKSADDLHVTDDCELLRVLNLHYNRSNHIAIPENFRSVSETTLREFFKSLQQNKDTEQSWKKAIYKIIARLDDNVPEYFKNPNFMEQLE
ncbi:homeobox protein prospero isoform X2 [Dermatophagoides farinae]|uniref:homeobox protein prospero isoform X2 n=1 Tax=Dermatophagoides farinae TaxID=6954 RepID=UPI003F5DE3CC